MPPVYKLPGAVTDQPLDSEASPKPRFLVWVLTALCLTLLITVVAAPLAAIVMASAGYHFPFPRIFDRTLIVTLFAILLVFGPRLGLFALLRAGFSQPKSGIWHALIGLGLSVTAMSTLFGMAEIAGADINAGVLTGSALRYLPAAISVALVEEAFFRAFLLAGAEREIGSFGALLLSSGFYAAVHVIRSPARFYITGFEPLAGAKTLATCAGRLLSVQSAPTTIGLFLLGMVLGQAFVGSRRVYVSLGLHAGFVMGAKSWRLAVRGALPRWLVRPGLVPLLDAPAAWVLSVLMFTMLYLWVPPTEFSGSGRSDAKTRRRA
jgi:membrane protease YdiL (CAAX protease family)